MATPESKVKAKIRAILKKHGIYYVMPIGSGYGNSGVPDFICCVKGRFVGIEAKAGKNRPTLLQDKNLSLIVKANGEVMVINEDNLHHVDALGNR